MLNNNCIVEYYKYNIDLLKPYQFIIQLAHDISCIQNPNFSIATLLDQAFIDEINIDFSSLPAGIGANDSVSWLASEIATYYNKEIIKSLDLSKSAILLLHQPSKIVYVLNKTKAVLDRNQSDDFDKKRSTKNALVNLIKEQKIFAKIIEAISDQKVKDCILNSITIEFDEIYQNCVSVNNATPIEVPYVKYNYLDTTIIEDDIIETSDVWINKDKFREAFRIDIGASQRISSIRLKSNKTEVGLMYNDFVFPIVPKIENIIHKDFFSDFRWIQIKEVFKLNDNKQKPYISELIQDFKKKFKDKKLTDLLSYLQENLYLKSDLLAQHPTLQKYFTSSLKISDVKYLKKFNFFISDLTHSNSFGIYTFDKIGEDATHFNLLHWFNNEQGNKSKYRDNLGPKKVNKDVESVSALHPEISFYFITQYFEDFLQEVLDELEIEYINNFHLFQGTNDLGEFDFLVKNNGKFYFIEAKTTLTKYYIKEYQNKCKKILEAFTSFNIDINFVIIGAYSNTTIEDLKVYVDNSHKGLKKYNVKNSFQNTIPYMFEMPIDNSGKVLHCISESNFSSLKQVIKKICLK